MDLSTLQPADVSTLSDDDLDFAVVEGESKLTTLLASYIQARARRLGVMAAAADAGNPQMAGTLLVQARRPEARRYRALLEEQARRASVFEASAAVRAFRDIADDARAAGENGDAIKALREAASISRLYPESSVNVINANAGSQMVVTLNLPERVGRERWLEMQRQNALPPGQQVLDAQVVPGQQEGVVVPLRGAVAEDPFGSEAVDPVLEGFTIRPSTPEEDAEVYAEEEAAEAQREIDAEEAPRDEPEPRLDPEDMDAFHHALDREERHDLRDLQNSSGVGDLQIGHGATEPPRLGEGAEPEASAKALPDAAFTESEIPRSKLDAALDALKARRNVPRASR